MKLLCLDVPQPGASLEKYQPYMLDEVRHGWQMYKSDIIRDIYFRQDRPGVVIIVEAESADAARKSLSKFPRRGRIDRLGCDSVGSFRELGSAFCFW